MIPTPASQNFYSSYFFAPGVRGVGDYYREVTNSRLSIVGQSFGWFDIGHSVSEHKQGLDVISQRDRAFNWGIAAARINGVPVDDFPHKVVFVNIASDHGALGSNKMLIAHGVDATFDHTFVQHEFGHVLGLDHSWSTPPDKGYDDDFCIMSAFTTGFRFTLDVMGFVNQSGPGLNAAYVRQLGGLPDENIARLDTLLAPSLLVLAPLSGPEATPVLKAIVVDPIPPRVNTLWVELRHPSAWDQGIGMPSVVVHETRPGDKRSFWIRAARAGSGGALRQPGDEVASTDGQVVVRLFELWDDPPRALVLVSRPYGFGPNEAWTHEPYFGTRGTFFADVTGDKRADAIVVNADKVVVRRAF